MPPRGPRSFSNISQNVLLIGGTCLQIDPLGDKWFFLSKIIGQVLKKMESKTK